MSRLASIIARIADVGGFDQERTNGDVRFGKVLALFSPVAAKLDYLLGNNKQSSKKISSNGT